MEKKYFDFQQPLSIGTVFSCIAVRAVRQVYRWSEDITRPHGVIRNIFSSSLLVQDESLPCNRFSMQAVLLRVTPFNSLPCIVLRLAPNTTWNPWQPLQCRHNHQQGCYSNLTYRCNYAAPIGLASATSQLDRNAWQRVATYKSGSKQTWRRIFFVWNHIEKAQTDRTPAQLPLCWAATARFSCLLSSGSDSVLYSKFLCYVSGSSSRVAQCCTSPALPPWRRPVNHLVSLGCTLCGGLLIAHSSWSLERENARNYETKTSSSYFDVEWLPCSLVRGRISAPVDRRLQDRKQPHTPHKSCRTPLSVQLWVSKVSKSCQHFLNLLVKEKQLWQVNVLSPRMPLYGTLSLFRTSFASCYALRCVSLGCDVSTCKPYAQRATSCSHSGLQSIPKHFLISSVHRLIAAMIRLTLDLEWSALVRQTVGALSSLMVNFATSLHDDSADGGFSGI